ncbi:hypothetical protein [Micromonospora psammae]|uniref:hypothetical protein n=1 Tax=Micromonospora sp. CPCC 205556 TaxID=3122398 RepID=UPI002FF1C02F
MPGSVAPQSATGANDTPTSPLRWAASASPEFDLIEVEQWLRAQGKLPELATAERLWRHLAAASESPAAGLGAVGALLLARQRGTRSVHTDAHLASLRPDVDALADELGPQGAFDELWQRFSAPGPGRPFATPDNLADLMVGLADVRGGSVLDPAAGSGATLRADAFGGRTVDAVACHPPFGATNWGDEELGHDPRWIVRTTPRTNPNWSGRSTPSPTCASAGTPYR